MTHSAGYDSYWGTALERGYLGQSVGGVFVVFGRLGWVTLVVAGNWYNQRGVQARPTLTDGTIAVVGCPPLTVSQLITARASAHQPVSLP